jgi:hypothetical protein
VEEEEDWMGARWTESLPANPRAEAAPAVDIAEKLAAVASCRQSLRALSGALTLVNDGNPGRAHDEAEPTQETLP